MPLLFFTRRLLQWRGVDTLNLNPAARSDAFQKSSDDEQLAWLKADVLAGLKKGLEQKTYLGIVLAGKSIGSLAIAQAVSQAEALLPTAIVWLTPLLRYPVVVDAALAANGPQVHLCGGADRPQTRKSKRIMVRNRAPGLLPSQKPTIFWRFQGTSAQPSMGSVMPCFSWVSSWMKLSRSRE